MSLFSRLKAKAQPDLHHFQVGDQTLPIVRTTRKKSIALKNRPTGVAILVPKHFSNKRLQALLKGHYGWIQQTLKTLASRSPTHEAQSLFQGKQGDVLEFFGTPRTLRVEHAAAASSLALSQVQIDEDSCVLWLDRDKLSTPLLTDDESATQACQQIQAFMQVQAVAYLEPKLAHYAQQIGVQPKSLTVKGYKSRWGSCYADGRIQFNWRLMQAPSWVIDYVVVHELCHLVHANHSKAFWDLVNLHYPQTPEAKLVFKTHGARWIQLLA